MKYVKFGKTGLQVSELSFGTMTFGGEADNNTSEQLYKKCREVGINLFDCANIYHEGKSELELGRLIKPERSDVIVTTKVYFPTSKDINSKGLTRRNIMNAVEQSLKRLDTDYIDIYFMHHYDTNTPIEETLRAMTDLVQQGKILYVGISNFSAWQTMKALGVSEIFELASVACIQPMYNLVKRQAEVEIFPMAMSEGLAVLSYNPLAGGVLSGKYLEGAATSGRLIEHKMYKQRYGDQHTQDIARRFCELATLQGVSPVSLAIAWAASHPAVTSPLLGARTVEQLDDCLKALEIVMTPELRKEISALSPEPATATDRSEEVKK